jgi:hypothetical protein
MAMTANKAARPEPPHPECKLTRRAAGTGPVVRQYPVVLLAGGSFAPGWPAATGGVRLLTRLGGGFLWQYLLRALAASGRVCKLALVAPPAVATRLGRELTEYLAQIVPAGTPALTVQAVPAAGDMPGSAWLGAQALQAAGPVLFVCDDLPLLTAAALDDFLDRCEKTSGAAFYPLVREERCREQYPQLHRTFFTLREGSFTGGNLVLMDSRTIPKILPAARKVFALRKSPPRLAAFLGPAFSLKFALGRLSLPEVEARLTELTGLEGRAVLSPYPEVAEDLDRPEEIAAMAAYVQKIPLPVL